MIVTVTPNPSLDLTYLLASGDSLSLLDDRVHRAAATTLEASGKGVNVSRVLVAAGYASTAVFPAGGRTGTYLSELLAAEGVPYLAVPVAGATRINTSLLQPDGRTLKVNGPGARLSDHEVRQLMDAVQRAIAPAARTDSAVEPGNWLVMSGSLPPGTDPGLVPALARLARDGGLHFAVDASGETLAAALEFGVDLLAPNAQEFASISPEAATVLSSPSPDGELVDGLADAAVAVSGRSGTELLVSLGSLGAIWTDGRDCYHAQAPAVVPVNTAGAGDTMLAGWLAGTGSAQGRLARAVTWARAACLAATTVPVDALSAVNDDVHVRVRDPTTRR